jgi:uncharacterized membrane protein
VDSAAETVPVESRASLIPTALIGFAFLVVAVVFAASSDWYSAFLAVHVTFVVVWIGGGSLLTILGIRAERTGDGAELAAIARQAAFAGERIFAPAAIVVVAMGIAMVLDGHLGFDHFWLVFGLIGFATTFVIGVGILSPMAKKLAAMIGEHGTDAPGVKALISKILLVARADVAMLLLVVVDMTTKPFS